MFLPGVTVFLGNYRTLVLLPISMVTIMLANHSKVMRWEFVYSFIGMKKVTYKSFRQRKTVRQ